MSYTHKKAHVSLVGAGPGDPDLISLKGLKALQQADVVLYDALVSEELLEFAPKESLRVFVGKRARNHSYRQEEINRMLISYAFSHGHVVRLKGGDPFVFGRGYEELAYVEAFGITTSVIPGISSIASVPGLQKIPLTKRGLNESFWVITGTNSAGKLPNDVFQAARTSATVVILMGLGKLEEIVSIYRKNRKGELPIAIIQSGSTPEEKLAIGTINTIVEIRKRMKLEAPAIIIIGEVVGLHPQLATQMVREYGKKQLVRKR